MVGTEKITLIQLGTELQTVNQKQARLSFHSKNLQKWGFRLFEDYLHFLSYSWSTAFQFSSVTQSRPTLCDPMNYSTPGLPAHHQLLESIQTHIRCVGDTIQPSHPLSLPFPPALNLSQHQGIFKWVSSLPQVAKALEFQLQHQSSQWTLRTDLL